MDGKRPETTGGALPVGSRSSNREPAHSVSNGSFDLAGNDRKGIDKSIPDLDWTLLERLTLPGENASLSLHDGNGAFIKVAGGSKTLWNQTEEKLVGQRFTDFIEPNPALIEWFLKLEKGNQDSVFSAKIVTAHNGPIPVSLKRIPLFIGSQPSQSRILLKAVLDPAQAQIEPYESASFDCDPQGRFLKASDNWRSVLGVPKQDLKSLSLFETVQEEDRKDLAAYLETLLVSEEPQTRSFRFLLSTGDERTFLLSGKYSEKRFEFLAQDITLDSADPNANLQRISAKLSTTGLAWMETSLSHCRIINANFAFEQMTGFRRSELPCFTDLFGGDDDENIVSKAISSIQNATEDVFEIQMYRKDGDKSWVELKTHPLRDQTGQVHYTAFSIRDITKERESQKTAIQQENLRSLGQMASGIAHDFNNLLAPILGFSELLLNMPNGGRDDKKLISFLEKIKVAAQDGAAVVGRLREFYCNQDSSDEINSDIDLQKLAQQVRDLTQHRWKSQAEARGAHIEFRSTVRSNRFIHGNEPELRQALSNLVINAADAIEGDGVISLSIIDDGDDIRIRIKDTGCGMPEKIRAKCLDPFYSTKGKLGTGLGLSIVAGIVKHHNGNIKIESVEGTGSTINIRLPAIDANFEKAPPKRSSVSSNSLRIMLVDDEAVLLEVLSELLGSGGHKVENFENGEAALEAFRKDAYDLVITDRAMPNMSGDQLAKELKAIDPSIPIIMATGFGDMMTENEEKTTNVDLVLAKPVPLDVLNQKLSELTSNELN